MYIDDITRPIDSLTRNVESEKSQLWKNCSVFSDLEILPQLYIVESDTALVYCTVKSCRGIYLCGGMSTSRNVEWAHLCLRKLQKTQKKNWCDGKCLLLRTLLGQSCVPAGLPSAADTFFVRFIFVGCWEFRYHVTGHICSAGNVANNPWSENIAPISPEPALYGVKHFLVGTDIFVSPVCPLQLCHSRYDIWHFGLAASQWASHLLPPRVDRQVRALFVG